MVGMVGLDCRCPVIACKVLEPVFQDHLEDGMESQPGEGGEEPGPDSGLPGGGTSDAGAAGLAGFAPGGVWDSTVPSAAVAAALEGAAGEGWRCEGGSRAAVVGAGRAAAATAAWWSAAKLGLIRAAIREDDDGLGGEYHGDLPDE